MSAPIRVLLVEDNPGDARLVTEALSSPHATFHVTHAEGLDDALAELAGDAPDVIIADLNLPDSEGLETFDAIARAAPAAPVVVLTVLADEETAVSAVANGAQDYLYKAELPGHALPRVVRYSIERNRLRTELAELSGELQQLMRHAVHDLQSPVSAVAGVADLLAGGPGSMAEEDLGQLLGLLRRQSRRLGNLVADLMDVARLHEGVEPVPTSVSDVVREAVQSVPPPPHVTVRVDVPSEVVVPATHAGLARVMTNLLTNAYRYAASEMQVGARVTDARIEITVEDDGPGVTESFVPDLFQDFARGPEAEPDSGTGLGLAIVRRIVQTYGGEVRYSPSHRLGGARFQLSLPLDAS